MKAYGLWNWATVWVRMLGWLGAGRAVLALCSVCLGVALLSHAQNEPMCTTRKGHHPPSMRGSDCRHVPHATYRPPLCLHASAFAFIAPRRM